METKTEMEKPEVLIEDQPISVTVPIVLTQYDEQSKQLGAMMLEIKARDIHIAACHQELKKLREEYAPIAKMKEKGEEHMKTVRQMASPRHGRNPLAGLPDEPPTIVESAEEQQAASAG